jgi:perosamine synthetase
MSSFVVSPSVQAFLGAIQQVVGSSSREQPIGLHEPDFHGTQAWAFVKDCLDTGWVSSAGSWVNRFEQQLCTIPVLAMRWR